MSVREDEKLGSRQTAELKRRSREERLRKAVRLAAQGEPLSDIARRLKLDRRDIRRAVRARVDFPPGQAR